MAKPFPDHPNLRGGYAPIQMECDAPDLIIEGEVPKDLHGTFFRNGPNPQFAPRGAHHWFGGDGMLHAFHIENGRVSYKNRWARTKKWNLEHEAGEALFSAFNPMDSDPSVQGVETDGIANTNIVWHAGRLLALEEAHAPFELDPQTLESRGAWTFGDKLVGPMTAHPKMDPETGEMLFFGYSVDGMLSNRMSYHVVNREGELTESQFFDAPYASMVHDFLVTRDYVLFPIMPLTGSLERAMAGAPAFAWEPEKGTFIGVLKRGDDVANIRWFKGPPSYVFHPMNAFNEGDRITCDVAEYPEAPLFPRPDGTRGDPDKANAVMRRWHFDLGQNTDDFTSEQLDDTWCEFPRLDERFAGLNYRWGYAGCQGGQRSESDGFNAIACYDLEKGSMVKYDMGATSATSEPVFVPRSPDSPEGEGYLLANVWDATVDKSHLVILDAQNIEQGPLAKAYLDHRVPFGFHGNFVAGAGPLA